MGDDKFIIDPDLVLAKLKEILPGSMVEAASPYLPALIRIMEDGTLDEILAIARLLARGMELDAKSKIREAMTAPELAAEKEDLAELAKLIADEQYALSQWAKSISIVLMKSALTAVAAAAGFPLIF